MVVVERQLSFLNSLHPVTGRKPAKRELYISSEPFSLLFLSKDDAEWISLVDTFDGTFNVLVTSKLSYSCFCYFNGMMWAVFLLTSLVVEIWCVGWDWNNFFWVVGLFRTFHSVPWVRHCAHPKVFFCSKSTPENSAAIPDRVPKYLNSFSLIFLPLRSSLAQFISVRSFSYGSSRT